MDMSKTYRSAVEEFLPGMPIVFDRFHIMQLVNQTIDKIRRKQQQESNEEGYKPKFALEDFRKLFKIKELRNLMILHNIFSYNALWFFQFCST